jgi:uroporphyrinogen-III decarboxylase
MDNQKLFLERQNRIAATVALQKTDRTPVVILNDMFASRHMGLTMAEFVSDSAKACRAMIQSAVELGVDGIQLPFFNPKLLSLVWLSRVELPGVELPSNSLWQVIEGELMKTEDYDVIINKGWNYFYFDFLKNRLHDILKQLEPTFAIVPGAYQNCVEAGLFPLSGGFVMTPFELICGGRSMTKFFRDLYKMPDKVQAVFDAAMPDLIANAKQALAAKPFGVWTGGWRAASEFINPKLWQRFEWPYLKKLVEVTLEAGVAPIFHMDSNWDRDLEFFKEMPKGRCIFYPDHATNIYKIKEVLGDHMAINGDVPPTMLALGTPDDVYNYSRKLIRDIGPTGFILGQGCDIPPDAKVENVKAMVAAATGK